MARSVERECVEHDRISTAGVRSTLRPHGLPVAILAGNLPDMPSRSMSADASVF
jgi:hypothetical protein